jgi:hypothetical protein
VAGFVPSRSVEEPLHGEAASFFAKDAMWRTVNLRIKVESVVGNSGRDVPEMLDVAFALRQPQTTIEDVRAGFASFESAVFFLYRQDPAPRGIKKDAYSIVMDGAMIAEVVGDRLSLPAFRGLEPWEGTGLTEEQLIARARSYSELSERANEPESARERAVGDQFRPRS